MMAWNVLWGPPPWREIPAGARIPLPWAHRPGFRARALASASEGAILMAMDKERLAAAFERALADQIGGAAAALRFLVVSGSRLGPPSPPAAPIRAEAEPGAPA